MRLKTPALLILGLLAVAAPREASAAPFVVTLADFVAGDTLIGFNGLADEVAVTNQFAAQGLTFGGVLSAYDDQNFLFGGDAMQVLNSAAPFNCGVATNCQPFTLNFSSPTTRVGFLIATNAGTTTLTIAGGSLNFATSPTTVFVGIGDTNPFTSLTVAVTAGNGAAIIDNVRFNTVPEPATMMLVGTGLALAAVRRLRKR